jgi:uncharacterized damage-inducible protein DinB
MAEYNHWMNIKIVEACESLDPGKISEDRGAFFGSILGTLNHLIVADTVWLNRFRSVFHTYRELEPIIDIPKPEALSSIVCSKLPDLKVHRELIDQVFLSFSKAVNDDDLLKSVSYKSFKGIASTKSCFNLLMHVFNHQTHHRGQITTLLSQFGVDIGVTDLLVIVPDA